MTSMSDHSMDDTSNDDDVFTARRRVSEQRRHSHMSVQEEQERRQSIRDIMQDPELTPLERRQSIQSLMDGRRRSSSALLPRAPMSMAAAAAVAAAEFYDSSDDEMVMQDTNNTTDGGTLQQESAHSSLGPDYFDRLGRSASFSILATAGDEEAISNDHKAANTTARRMETCRPPCNHYQRNCSIISPCCGLAFGCRICHDECPVLPTPMNNTAAASQDHHAMDDTNTDDGGSIVKPKRRHSLPLTLEPELSHHAIDRFAITEVICRECFTRQDSKSNKCVSCGIQFGKYHCEKCNLWMSDEEQPYHCDGCGFCRVGGRDNFCHCHDCGMCIDAQAFDNHNCKAGKYMSSCPVCQENLFSSRSARHEMPCGHAIHWHCFKEFTSYDTRCPVCKKTVETHEQMAQTWSATAMSISMQPVPPEMARIVSIICNDCGERDENRQWHFLGVQCRKCSSFNTAIVGQEAAVRGVSPPGSQHTQGIAMTDHSPSRNGVSVVVEQEPVSVNEARVL